MPFTVYRLRLYPSKHQEWRFRQTIETCRILYNELLNQRIQTDVRCFEQKRELTERRKDNKYLKSVYSQVLQDVVFRLDRAYSSHLRGLTDFPHFKRKGRYNSFTYPQAYRRSHDRSFRGGGFRIAGSRLNLPMIGSIKIRPRRSIEGRLKTCTIIRDIDQWYACIAAESEPSSSFAQFWFSIEKPPMGIDVGINPLFALSDGTKIENPRYLKKSTEEIKALQKALSRKRPGSKNREKAKVKLGKAWRKLRRRRDDFAHKQSRFLADNCSTIVFEDLQINNIVKNHNLASAILDAAWGKLRRLTTYKVERRGGRVIGADPRGSSQECSGCHKLVPKHLSVRVHACPHCGLVLERNVNAARILEARGLERTHAETEPLLSEVSKFSRGSEKPTPFTGE